MLSAFILHSLWLLCTAAVSSLWRMGRMQSPKCLDPAYGTTGNQQHPLQPGVVPLPSHAMSSVPRCSTLPPLPPAACVAHHCCWICPSALLLRIEIDGTWEKQWGIVAYSWGNSRWPGCYGVTACSSRGIYDPWWQLGCKQWPTSPKGCQPLVYTPVIMHNFEHGPFSERAEMNMPSWAHPGQHQCFAVNILSPFTATVLTKKLLVVHLWGGSREDAVAWLHPLFGHVSHEFPARGLPGAPAFTQLLSPEGECCCCHLSPTFTCCWIHWGGEERGRVNSSSFHPWGPKLYKSRASSQTVPWPGCVLRAHRACKAQPMWGATSPFPAPGSATVHLLYIIRNTLDSRGAVAALIATVSPPLPPTPTKFLDPWTAPQVRSGLQAGV